MRRLLPSSLRRLWVRLTSHTQQPSPQPTYLKSAAVDDALPLPPRALLANRVVCEGPLLTRRVDHDDDSPSAALYRIYEHLVLDQHIELRNEFEAFWFHSSWAVCEIPDPKDPDPERYACLACIPKFLCLAFNKRIDLGLPRDAPSIFTGDMLEEWRAQERKREAEPGWVGQVPRLPEVLAIPHWDNNRRDFVPLETFQDERASKECAEKNVLIWEPHIHFAPPGRVDCPSTQLWTHPMGSRC